MQTIKSLFKNLLSRLNDKNESEEQSNPKSLNDMLNGKVIKIVGIVSALLFTLVVIKSNAFDNFLSKEDPEEQEATADLTDEETSLLEQALNDGYFKPGESVSKTKLSEYAIKLATEQQELDNVIDTSHITDKDVEKHIQELWDDKTLNARERQLAIQQYIGLQERQNELAKLDEKLKKKQEAIKHQDIKAKIEQGNASIEGKENNTPSEQGALTTSPVDKLHRVGTTQLYKYGVQPYGMGADEERVFATSYNNKEEGLNHVVMYITDDNYSKENYSSDYTITQMGNYSSKRHTFTDLKVKEETNNGQVSVEYTDGISYNFKDGALTAGFLAIRLEVASGVGLFNIYLTDKENTIRHPININKTNTDVYVNINQQLSEILSQDPYTEYLYIKIDKVNANQSDGVIWYEMFKSAPIVLQELTEADINKMKE